MPIYSFYRIVKDIIRTIFGGKFWRKFLIIILISIAIWFILHDKGYCVDETEDINYAAYNYYDSLLDDLILRLGNLYSTNPNHGIFTQLRDNTNNYFVIGYYGNDDGSSYLGGIPLNKKNLMFRLANFNTVFSSTPTTYDYLGLTGYPIYKYGNGQTTYTFYKYDGSTFTTTSFNYFYFPTYLYGYRSSNWLYFVQSIRNNDSQAIIELLQDIKSQNDTILEEMTQDVQDTSQGVVDTSIVDTSGTEQATQNVQSLLNIIKGFYDNIGDEVYTISFPIKDTSFTIRSDIISSHIRGTWLATFLNTFWYFIFGMYYLIFLFRIGKWLADGSLFEERRRT